MTKGKHIRLLKICPACGTSFTGRPNKKFCSTKCRFDFANAKKSEPRHEALALSKGECYIWDCTEPAYYYHHEPGYAKGYVICAVHHALRVRCERSQKSGRTELEQLIEKQRLDIEDEELGKDRTLRTAGARYYGFQHVTPDDDPSLEARICRHDPIAQLIDHLSGESGEPDGVPHPLDEAA